MEDGVVPFPRFLRFPRLRPYGWPNSTADKLYAFNRNGTRDDTKDLTLTTENGAPKGIWSNGTVIWVTDITADKIFAYRMPTSSAVGGGSGLFFSEDSTLKSLQLSGITLTPAFSANNLHYTALVDSAVHSTTVTASANDSGASMDIFWGGRGTTRRTAGKGPQVALSEGDNIIAIDVLAETTYLIRVMKDAAPPVSGGPLPQAPQSASLSVPHGTASASAAVFGEGKTRLILAEPMLDGGVRFVFAVPKEEEFEIQETVDLLGGIWRSPPDNEVKMRRESNANGQDQLTVILPAANEKQLFLRLVRRH